MAPEVPGMPLGELRFYNAAMNGATVNIIVNIGPRIYVYTVFTMDRFTRLNSLFKMKNPQSDEL